MGVAMTPEDRRRLGRLIRTPEFERGFDRGRKLRSWVHENKTAVTLGAIALAATAIWIYRQRATAPHFSVSGVWTDLARKQNIEIGSDLSIKEAQAYLNSINGKTSPAQGGTGLAEDGILGKQTSNAIRAFQAGNGLEQNGVIDDETGNALSYFAAATSKFGAMKKYAAVSPATIASLQKPVTYTPYAMPAARVFAGDFRTGIQSTSMYSPQNYYTDTFGAWVLPEPLEECWWG